MSYVFDSNTDPNERTRRKRLAEALMLRGTDTSPIQSPWQGAARMAQALMGGIELGQYDKQDREDRDQAKKDFEAGMGTGVPATSSVAAALQPSTASGSPVGGFSNAVSRTLGFEGGLNPADTNGTPTNFGINQAANPDVDVKSLTKEGATAIYKKNYWDAIGGDQLAAQNPALAHVAFDTAVLAGPGKAKGLLAASGGDPVKFLQLREQFQNALLQRDPAKYGQYAKAWADRTAGLRADVGYAGGPQGTAVAGGTGQPVLQGGSDTLQPPAPAGAAPAAAPDTSAQQAAIVRAMQNPNLSAGQKQLLMARYQQLQRDPTVELQRKQLQFNIDEAQRKASREAVRDPIEVEGLRLGNKEKERTLSTPPAPPVQEIEGPDGTKTKYQYDGKNWIPLPGVPTAPAGAPPMFKGTGEQAQALNHLVRSGRLTQEQAAMLAAGKFTTGPDGAILFVTPDAVFPNAAPPAKAPTEVPAGTASPQTTKPDIQNPGVRPITAPKDSKPLTESESKVFQFTRRADAAARTIQSLEGEGTRSVSRFLDSSVPGGNYLVGENFQKFAQAKREFINALLRRESGAVIGKEEEANFDKQYMPQPGDGAAVIEQKRVARQRAIQAMKEELGGKYKEPTAEELSTPTNDPDALKKKYGLN